MYAISLYLLFILVLSDAVRSMEKEDHGIVAAPGNISFSGMQTNVDTSWLYICPGYIYTLSPQYCNNARYTLSYYTRPDNYWVTNDCSTGDYQFQPPIVCSYLRVDLQCFGDDCDAFFLFSSYPQPDVVVTWTQAMIDFPLMFNISNVDPNFPPACVVLALESDYRNRECLNDINQDLVIQYIPTCVNGAYETAINAVAMNYSIVVYDYESFNSVIDFSFDGYTELARSVAEVPVPAGARRLVNIVTDPVTAGEPITGSWSSNFDTSNYSYLVVIGSSSEGMSYIYKCTSDGCISKNGSLPYI